MARVQRLATRHSYCKHVHHMVGGGMQVDASLPMYGGSAFVEHTAFQGPEAMGFFALP